MKVFVHITKKSYRSGKIQKINIFLFPARDETLFLEGFISEDRTSSIKSRFTVAAQWRNLTSLPQIYNIKLYVQPSTSIFWCQIKYVDYIKKIRLCKVTVLREKPTNSLRTPSCPLLHLVLGAFLVTSLLYLFNKRRKFIY